MSDDPIPSTHAEKAVLSAMLQSPGVFVPKALAEGISVEHFHTPGNAIVFSFLVSQADPSTIESVAMAEELHRRGELENVGGMAAVADLMTYAPGGHHWDQHVHRLREYLFRRRSRIAAEKIVEEAGLADVADLQKLIADSTKDALDALDPGSKLTTAQDAVAAVLEKMREATAGEMPGISTGIDAVDIVTKGFRPGQLWVVAGPTSGGKSVLMLQGVAAVLDKGGRALVFSLEMEAWECMARLASCRGGIPLETMMDPKRATKGDIEKAKRALQQNHGADLAIDDKGSRTLEQIASLAAAYRDRNGGKLDLVAIDYIQLIESTRRYRTDNQSTEIGEVVKAMKNLAKRLRCCVITGSQLNDDGRLFGSRAIGHHADVVLKIDEDGIVGEKVRSGPRGQMFPLKLNGQYQRFERVG